MKSTGLVTDFYQISMTYALFRLGRHENQVVFDRFYRERNKSNTNWQREHS